MEQEPILKKELTVEAWLSEPPLYGCNWQTKGFQLYFDNWSTKHSKQYTTRTEKFWMHNKIQSVLYCSSGEYITSTESGETKIAYSIDK